MGVYRKRLFYVRHDYIFKAFHLHHHVDYTIFVKEMQPTDEKSIGNGK
jgi:hypothetical protein